MPASGSPSVDSGGIIASIGADRVNCLDNVEIIRSSSGRIRAPPPAEQRECLAPLGNSLATVSKKNDWRRKSAVDATIVWY